MRIIPFLTAIFSLPCLAFAASPYEPSAPAPVGPGVEEVWTDNGVRYYRGLPGAPRNPGLREPGAQRYQPEVEYASPQPLSAPPAKRIAKSKAVKKAPVKTARKSTTAKRRYKKRAPAVKRVTPAPVQQAAMPADMPPPAQDGYNQFTGSGILGTTRLQ